MEAVKRGDMDTAQRLVNVAARISGYIPVTRYHQTAVKFTQFSTDNPVAISLPKSHINLVFDNAITLINHVIKYI